jgi:ABC-type molybdate transport system substrate-binding protein
MRSLAHAAMVALMAIGSLGAVQAQSTEVSVFAAGSLRGALTEVAQAWQAAEPAHSAKFTFGASGLLKDRLAGGELADVFASANMEHPQALAAAGLAEAPQSFARNQLCVLAAPDVAVSSQTLVDRLLDPAVRLGTSTPKADPSGDYTWTMFERIEQRGRAGAFKTLSSKALQLTGGPNSPPPPANRSVYGALMADGQADLFVTYCTNAVVAMREVPTLRRIEVPADINVHASYGVTVMNGASDAARRFVRFLLSPPGQGVLARHGFAAP